MALIGLLVLFIIGYSLFEFRWVIQGPTIEIETPQNGEIFENSLIEVRGRIKNVVFLGLNDFQISVDPSGAFKEKILLSPGFNIIKLEIKDRFDRAESQFLEVLYIKKI